MRLVKPGLLAVALAVILVAAPAAADITNLTIDGTALIDGNDVIVSGTVECDLGEAFWVRVNVDQTPDPDVYRARGSDKLICNTSPQPWEVRAESKGASPSEGPAKACAVAGTFGPTPQDLIQKQATCRAVTLVAGGDSF